MVWFGVGVVVADELEALDELVLEPLLAPGPAYILAELPSKFDGDVDEDELMDEGPVALLLDV